MNSSGKSEHDCLGNIFQVFGNLSLTITQRPRNVLSRWWHKEGLQEHFALTLRGFGHRFAPIDG